MSYFAFGKIIYFATIVLGFGRSLSCAQYIHLDVIRSCHHRWAKALLAAEWQLGPRDNSRQIHPLLYPAWEDLPEADRKMDLDLLEFFNHKYLLVVSERSATHVALCNWSGEAAPKQIPIETFIDEFSELFIHVRRA